MRPWWRDPLFWCALAAGPLFWLGYFLWDPRPLELDWPARAVGAFLVVALVYPVLEELVFRGALQGWLWQRTGGRLVLGPITLANLLTSIAFAAFHLLQQPPLWAAGVILPSLVFGYFRDKHRRLAPAMVLHCVYNAGFFWLFRPLV